MACCCLWHDFLLLTTCAYHLAVISDLSSADRAVVQVLKIGQLEFNDLWHEGASSFVRMVTKPEFGSWVSACGTAVWSGWK